MAALRLTVKTLKLRVNTDGKMYVFDERISVDVNQVEKQLSVKSISTVHHVNVTLIVLTQNVTNKSLYLKKMKKNT